MKVINLTYTKKNNGFVLQHFKIKIYTNKVFKKL